MEDKRKQTRLRIPESKIRYKHDLGFSLFNQYIGPGDLMDISKSGAGFVISRPVNLEDLIKVKIHIPGEKNLILRGQVKWVEPDTETGRHRVGMQFAPYGYRREYNSLNKLTRLKHLSQIYH